MEILLVRAHLRLLPIDYLLNCLSSITEINRL